MTATEIQRKEYEVRYQHKPVESIIISFKDEQARILGFDHLPISSLHNAQFGEVDVWLEKEFVLVIYWTESKTARIRRHREEVYPIDGIASIVTNYLPNGETA